MKKHLRPNFSAIAATVLLSLSANLAYGRQLSPEEALYRAQRTDAPVMNTMSTDSRSVAPTLAYTATAEDSDLKTVYIFNRGIDNGFLLVSADDASGAALLGYSDSGNINPDDLPENMKWWISQYSAEIAAASTKSGRAFDYGDFEIPELPAIAPIVKTHWKQTSPYNDYCPVISGVKAPTGCVATAMAQVMKVHNWPLHGKGQYSYHSSTAGKTLTVNFADSTYLWDKMLDSYSEESSAESVNAVASLMYSCGVSVAMSYHATSSSSSYTTAAKALYNYFDYDKGMRILHRDYYGIQDWFDLIYSEVAAGRPVLYSGSNETIGHAFVCDGYDKEGYFHINWGWGGMSDGYFLLTAMNPQDQGVGGSSSGYNNGQSIIVGIQPPVDGSVMIPVMEFNSNFQFSQTGYSRDDASVHVIDRRGIFCQTIGNITATMGLRFTDTKGDTVYVAGTTSRTYSFGQAFTGYNVDISEFPKAEGEYEVAPAVMDEVGRWWDCDVKMTANRYINLKITADSLLFTPTTVARVTASEVEVLSPIYPGLECGFRAVLTNNSDEEFFERVAPTLVLDHKDIAQCDPLSIELMPGQSGVFEWIGDFPSNVTPGEYLMWFVDGNSLDVSTEGLPVTVYPVPTRSNNFEITPTTLEGVVGTEDSPAVYTSDQMTFRITVRCNSGYFSDNVCGGIFPAGQTSGINTTEFSYIAAGEGMTAYADYVCDNISFGHEGQVYYVLAEGEHYGRIGTPMYFTIDPTAGLVDLGAEKDNSALRITQTPGEVTVEAPATITALTLYSAEGGQVGAAMDLSGSAGRIYTGDLTPGIYILSAQVAGQALEAHKLIIR